MVKKEIRLLDINRKENTEGNSNIGTSLILAKICFGEKKKVRILHCFT